jgi:hypothetical protein
VKKGGRDDQTIMRDRRIHARVQAEQPDLRRNGLWIAVHNIRRAMGGKLA